MRAEAVRGAARRVRPSWWSPLHTVALIVLVALLAGLLPFVKMSLVVNGLVLASIIALGAIGLTLIYGILNMANVAHGDYMTLGAYVALFFAGTLIPALGAEGGGIGPFTFGYPLLVAMPLSIAAVAAFAVAVDRLIYRRLASLGVAIALRGLVQLLWSGDVQRLPRESREVWHLPMEVRVPPDSLFIAIVAIALVAATYLVLSRTKMGKAMRATADNPDLALVSGISTQRVIRWTWVMGAALAATAGVLLAVFQANIIPIMGWKFLIPLFAAVILGGIGSPYGALAGALIIGLTMEVSTQWINPSYKPAAAFALMLLVLLVRPRGLFGPRQ